MSSILERLLVLATPFLAAVAIRKKKTAKKPSKRPTVPRTVPRSTARTTRRNARGSQGRVTSARASRPSARLKRAKKTLPHAKRRTAGETKTRSTKTTRHASRAASRQKDRGPKSAGAAAPETESAEPLPKPVAPTGRAILLAPENGKYADGVYPKFRWLSVGGATRYEVAWSEGPSFSEGHSVISVATEAAVPVEKPLRVGVVYYWRVRGGNEGGWGLWSPPVSFRVLEESEAA